MPPMNQIVVQTLLLPPDRRDETVLNQAKNLLRKSLVPVNENLAGKEYLIGNFSAADLMLGHSCFMANRLGCVGDDMSNICLLYTSPSPRDLSTSRMPSSA